MWLRPCTSLRHSKLLQLAALIALVAAPLAGADPPKRDVPDYDGRGNAGASDEPLVIWIPRVVPCSALLAVNEYLLRRPIGWLIRHAEAGHWVDSIESILSSARTTTTCWSRRSL